MVESVRNGSSLWLMMVMMMVAMLTCAVSSKPVLHEVGGNKQGWKPDINFTEWSIHEKFYVDDWLYFGFDKNNFNVLEVNKTSYEKCIEKDFIKNITRGGRDVFHLTEAKPFYFLCGGGHCFHGMKLAVDVEEFIPSPAPSPTKNSSPSNTGSRIILPIVFAIALVWAFLLK